MITIVQPGCTESRFLGSGLFTTTQQVLNICSYLVLHSSLENLQIQQFENKIMSILLANPMLNKTLPDISKLEPLDESCQFG